MLKKASFGQTVMQKLQATQPNISRSWSTERGSFSLAARRYGSIAALDSRSGGDVLGADRPVAVRPRRPLGDRAR